VRVAARVGGSGVVVLALFGSAAALCWVSRLTRYCEAELHLNTLG